MARAAINFFIGHLLVHLDEPERLNDPDTWVSFWNDYLLTVSCPCGGIYLEAVESASGPNIDAMLIRMYDGDRGKDGTAERRHSPAVCTGSREQTITAALDSLTRLAGPG
jgi:hypothetical protein